MAKVDAFLKNGGTILFDTRDAGRRSTAGFGATTPETQKLREILSFVDVPPLEPVPPDHVLTKAFYLLSEFPGRWASSELWVESLVGRAAGLRPAGARRRRRLADPDHRQRPRRAPGRSMTAAASSTRPCPSDPRQRELAFRAGVNIVMYTLTGNYKADQVHVPALLERLGPVTGFEPRSSSRCCRWPLIAALGAVLARSWCSRCHRWQRIRGVALRARSPRPSSSLALVNPVLQREEREALPGIVALVVDESASQNLGDRARADRGSRRRAEGAARRRSAASRSARCAPATEPDGDGTALFSELTELVDDVPPEQIAGAIFVTDGIVHDVPENAAVARLQRTDPRADHRRRRTSTTAASCSSARRASPSSARRRASTIASSTRPASRAPASTSRCAIDGTGGRDRQVTVGETPHDRRAARACRPHHRRARGGAAAENELALENNVAVAEIDVVREHLRVLLVSGEPHAGERTWRNVLKSDAAVDLVHFTILRPPEKQDGTPINELSLIAFPTRELFEEKIDEFDLIIFDRYQSRGVLPIVYYDNLAALRARWRRRAGRRRPRLCRDRQPLPHAARPDPAGRADRRGHRGALPGRDQPPSGRATR